MGMIQKKRNQEQGSESQDIVLLSSKSQKMTPKHLGLGVAVSGYPSKRPGDSATCCRTYSLKWHWSAGRSCHCKRHSPQVSGSWGSIDSKEFLPGNTKGIHLSCHWQLWHQQMSGTGTYDAYGALRRTLPDECQMDFNVPPAASRVVTMPTSFTDLEDSWKTKSQNHTYLEVLTQWYNKPDASKNSRVWSCWLCLDSFLATVARWRNFQDGVDSIRYQNLIHPGQK